MIAICIMGTVYAGLVFLTTLVFLNLAPFAHRVRPTLPLVSLVALLVLLAITWISFPFTVAEPLKVFFQQKVFLVPPAPSDPSGAVREVLNATTYVYAPHGYVDELLIPTLPSSWGKELDCAIDEKFRPGLLGCGWASDLVPSPGSVLPVPHVEDKNASSIPTFPADPAWFTFSALRLTQNSARVSIRGTNTRSCRLFFDTPVHALDVHGPGSTGVVQPGYEFPEEGIPSVLLWSREWEKEFVVDFTWDGEDAGEEFTGRAACEWIEYVSATAGTGREGHSAQIPALEEIWQFFPLWATPNKLTYGLVEAEMPFAV